MSEAAFRDTTAGSHLGTPIERIAPGAKGAVHPTVVLAVLCVGEFIAALDVFIVNVALPKVGIAFDEHSLSNLSWILNAYAIVIAALMIPAGRLADVFGRKRVFLLGLGLLTAASIGAACSGSFSSSGPRLDIRPLRPLRRGDGVT